MSRSTRPGDRRRVLFDRRTVLWTGVFLLAAHVGLSIALEANAPLLDSPRMTQGIRFLKAGRDGSPRRLTIGVFGSSRTRDGVQPDYVMTRLKTRHGIESEVFNFSRPGSGSLFEFLMVRRLAVRDVLPDIAVIDMVPLLRIDRSVEESLMYPSELREMRARGWVPEVADLKQRYVSTPWFESRQGLVGRIASRWADTLVENTNGPNDRGGCLREEHVYGTSEWDKMTTNFVKIRGDNYREFHVDKVADEAQNAVVAECRRLGVQPILVMMPEGPWFRALYGPNTAADLDAYAADLADRHGALLVNGRLMIDDEKLYFDSHHLLKDGAKQFSDRLADEIGARFHSGSIGFRSASGSNNP